MSENLQLPNVSDTPNGILIGTDPKPPVPTPPPTTTNTLTLETPTGKYSEEDLAKVRKQEKDKLYPEINDLRSQVEELRKEREARLEAERKAQEEADAASRRKVEEETDVRTLLAQKEQEWQVRLDAEKTERERAFALLERERQFSEVSDYRAQRMDQAREEIMPELLDLVTGSTPDEIDQSIAGLKERSERILASATQAVQAQRREMTGTRVTSPSAGPLDTSSDSQTFTPEQIANMSASEYAKNRSKLLGSNYNANARGLFG